MTAQEDLPPITVLAVGLSDSDWFRELTDVLVQHGIYAHFAPPDADDSPETISNLPPCHIALFAGPQNDPPPIISALWRQSRIPAIVTEGVYERVVPAEGVFGGLPASCPSECVAPLLAIAAERGRELAESLKRIHQLERSLEGRRTVELAKWKLIEEQGISEPEAHTRLQRTARSLRIPLPEVAQRFLDSGALEPNEMSKPPASSE